MAKIAKESHVEPKAWIVSSKDRGRKSIKKGKVFLKDKETFEIELFNPLQDSVLADIKLNGKSIAKSGLVLRPGQRFYLDCFIDDQKKFVFNTYEIDSSDEESVKAIEKNGLLEVFFYKEEVITIDNWINKVIVEKWYPYYPHNPYPYYPSYPTILYGTITTNISGNINLTNSNTTKSLYSSNVINTSMETGRVEKGEKSSQKFKEIDMDFQNFYVASTVIQILPDSRRPIETKEVKSKNKSSNEIIDLIKKLSELHESGILTNDEFNSKKELLSKI